MYGSLQIKLLIAQLRYSYAELQPTEKYVVYARDSLSGSKGPLK